VGRRLLAAQTRPAIGAEHDLVRTAEAAGGDVAAILFDDMPAVRLDLTPHLRNLQFLATLIGSRIMYSRDLTVRVSASQAASR
jgi:hypothetical protein